jgi:hypothetical protein
MLAMMCAAMSSLFALGIHLAQQLGAINLTTYVQGLLAPYGVGSRG